LFLLARNTEWAEQQRPARETYPMRTLGLRKPAQMAGTLVVLCCLRSVSQSSPPPRPPLGLFDALQSTLANQPAVHIQEQQVFASQGARQQTRGQFDAVLGASFSQARVNNPLTLFDQQQAALLGIVTNTQVSNVTTLNLEVDKQYRNGLSFNASLLTNRTTDNIYNIPGTNLSALSFQVNVPLLRGRGRSVVAAQETAADIEVQASLLDLNQTISSLLLDTASSYWNAVGAATNLKVAQGSEERGKVYLDNVQTLIDADRVPKAEIQQVKANLATRTAARITAEQNLIAARQRLGLAMGVNTNQMAAIETPTDEFPIDDGRALAAVGTNPIQNYFDLAITRRADYLAAKKRETEQATLVTAARNGVLPQLNLNLSSGYSSLEEGTGVLDFLRSPGSAVRGPDASAGITYRFPPSKDAALGGLTVAQANLRQAQLRSLQSSQSIMAAVVTAVAGVRNAIFQLQKAQEAVTASSAALQGEREKYRLGAGQLVDVLTMEDRLTEAQEAQVTAQLGYALALAQLRFATGTIVEPDQTIQSINRDVFLTVPELVAKTPAGRD
jgi:outer membrane protein TolC